MNVNRISTEGFPSIAGLFSDFEDKSCGPVIDGCDLVSHLSSIEDDWNSGSFIREAALSGHISIRWQEYLFFCRKSLTVDEFNFLIFEGRETFIIVQRDHTIEAVIVPLAREMYFLPGFYNPNRALLKLEKFLEDNYEQTACYVNDDGPKKFGGVLVDHPSPYHYYAIKLFSLYSLVYGGNVLPLPVAGRRARYFFNVEPLFKDRVRFLELPVDNRSVLKHALQGQKFFCFFGIKRWKRGANEERKFDELVLRCSLDLKVGDPRVGCLPGLVTSNARVLWVGITSSKRSWIEEEAAVTEIISWLSERVNSLVVVVDGITTAVGAPKFGDAYKSDLAKAKRIIDRMPANVFGTTVVGETAAEKVRVAHRANFFIGNYASGSLWISRVARKPGVTHLSNAAISSARKMHFHPLAKCIPMNLVEDVVSPGSHDNFRVSYSIDPQEFIRFGINEMKSCGFVQEGM